MRIRDVRNEGGRAYAAFAAEHGLSLPEYARLLTAEVARNVALMHNLGKAHGYLSSHNVTIDGCVVDFDSVSAGSPKKIAKDVREVLDTLTNFSNLKCVDPEVFLEAYFKNRNNIPSRELRKLALWLLSDRRMGLAEAKRLIGLSRR